MLEMSAILLLLIHSSDTVLGLILISFLAKKCANLVALSVIKRHLKKSDGCCLAGFALKHLHSLYNLKRHPVIVMCAQVNIGTSIFFSHNSVKINVFCNSQRVKSCRSDIFQPTAT